MKLQNISKATREILSGLTFLNYAFEQNLINESSLARLIRPRVESKLGRKTSVQAITTAVRRFLKDYEPQARNQNFFKLLQSSKLLLRTGLAEINFKRTQKTFDNLTALEKTINFSSGEKMYLLQRSEEITVIADKNHAADILSCAPKNQLLSENQNRAVVTITYDPYYFAESFGGLHFYTGQFAFHGIGIYLIFSTYSATSFVIDEANASKAYKNLSNSLGEISKTIQTEEKK